MHGFQVKSEIMLSVQASEEAYPQNQKSREFMVLLTTVQYRVWPPWTLRTAVHRRLIDSTSRRRVAPGIACHSCCSSCARSWRVAGGGLMARTRRPSTSHRCSMGLRSGERAGQSILTTPCCRRKVRTTAARWHGALSSWKMAPLPTACRAGRTRGLTIVSRYATPVRRPWTMSRGLYGEG